MKCQNVCTENAKKNPSATVSTLPANFELGMNSQAEPKVDNNEVKSNVTVQPIMHMNTPKLEIQCPVINIQQPSITVSPVINVCAQDLVRNAQGTIELLPITINLMININQ